MTPRPPRSPLFPYTTLFRSICRLLARGAQRGPAAEQQQRAQILVVEGQLQAREPVEQRAGAGARALVDRKSTRLNSSHPSISYAVFCLKKKSKRRTSARRPA